MSMFYCIGYWFPAMYNFEDQYHPNELQHIEGKYTGWNKKSNYNTI